MIELQQNDQVLTTKQVIDYLEKEWGEAPPLTTIYYYVRQGKLIPKYEDNWRIEGTMVFDKEIVEVFAKEFKRPEGHTLSEVSKIVGLHVTTLQKYIKEGSLDASKILFKGKPTYFVSNEVLTNLLEKDYVNKGRVKRKDFFTKDKKFFLYQSYRNDTTNDYGRIVQIENNTPTLRTAHGSEIRGAAIIESGYLPLYSVPTFKRVTKKNYAVCELITSTDIKNKEYRLFDFLYQYVGAENIDIEQVSEKVRIKIKPALIHLKNETLESYNEILLILDTYIIEGTVQLRHNGLYIGTDFESITINIPKKIKEQLRELADKSEMSLENFLKEKILKHLKN